jgi:pimeloyl-ACP methyl ester carboxylesterase
MVTSSRHEPTYGASIDTDVIGYPSGLVVHRAGSGPPLVLLHGLTSSRFEWTGLADTLMRSFTCVTWDARAHGEHEAGTCALGVAELRDDLARVIDALRPEKPVLVGHSLGAVTALEYVRRYGCAALAGIVLVDHTPRLLAGPGWELGVYSGFTPADHRAFEFQVRRDPAEAYLRLLAFGFGPQVGDAWIASDPFVQRLRERMRDMPVAPWLSLWKSFAGEDYRDDIRRVTVPLLAVLGGASNFYDAIRLGRWYADALPGAEVVRYDGADHAPHLAAPTRFARDVARFARHCMPGDERAVNDAAHLASHAVYGNPWADVACAGTR